MGRHGLQLTLRSPRKPVALTLESLTAVMSRDDP